MPYPFSFLLIVGTEKMQLLKRKAARPYWVIFAISTPR
jgi:hypothetical protein